MLFETARRLKSLSPDISIVVGGQHASLFASEISDRYRDCIDGVIQGEAEAPLLTICRALAESSSANVPTLLRDDR